MAYDAAKQLNFSFEAVVLVAVTHVAQDFLQTLVALALLAFELQVEAKFAEADGAEGERLLVCFGELRGAVHETLIGLTVSHR